MTAEEVVRQRKTDWNRLEMLLANGGVRRGTLDAPELLELSSLYRSAAGDAARVRAAGADDGTIAYLDTLLARAHNEIYRAPPTRRGAFGAFLVGGFPLAIRRNLPFFWVASAAFYLPFLFGFLSALFLPGFAPAVMGEDQMETYRNMHNEMPEHGRSLGSGSFSVSFYIQHNTSIGFQVFANGIFAGVGSALMLVYQGLVIGAVVGFLVGDDKGRFILTFMCGHGPWELTAIVVAGAAGIRMGWSLVATNGLTRLASLRAAGPEVARLIGGAAIMFSVAAAIEGLWSPSQVPALGKYVFAIVQALLVTAYLALGGRSRA